MKELRKQMADIEKNLTEQVVTNQQRAHEAFVSLQSLLVKLFHCSTCPLSQTQLQRREQELRTANKEITALKKRCVLFVFAVMSAPK